MLVGNNLPMTKRGGLRMSQERRTVIPFGEILWDLLPTGAVLGGAPLNFAYRINSLGDQAIVVSRLGQDALGQKALGALAAFGMENTYLQRDSVHTTGTVRVELDESGNPTFLIASDVAYDFIEATDELMRLVADADCFYFGTVAQRSPRSRESCQQLLIAAAERAVKFLDINLRRDCFSADTVTSSLQAADILKLNEQETLSLSSLLALHGSPDVEETAVALVRGYELQCCVVSLGAEGALAISNEGEKAYVPGYRVQVVDTVGAGDAFAAGFIHEYLRGACLGKCCEYGNALGALVAAQKGGTAPLQGKEVSQFLAANTERVFRRGLEKFAVK